jgi:hypothetical protein
VTPAKGDLRFRETLYAADFLDRSGGAAVPWENGQWEPELCVQGRCVEPQGLPTRFYLPEKDMVVVVRVMQQAFTLTSFDGQG